VSFETSLSPSVKTERPALGKKGRKLRLLFLFAVGAFNGIPPLFFYNTLLILREDPKMENFFLAYCCAPSCLGLFSPIVLLSLWKVVSPSSIFKILLQSPCRSPSASVTCYVRLLQPPPSRSPGPVTTDFVLGASPPPQRGSTVSSRCPDGDALLSVCMRVFATLHVRSSLF